MEKRNWDDDGCFTRVDDEDFLDAEDDGVLEEEGSGFSPAENVIICLAAVVVGLAIFGFVCHIGEVNEAAGGQSAGYYFDGQAPDLMYIDDADPSTDAAVPGDGRSDMRLDLYTGAVYLGGHSTPYIGPDGTPLVLPQAKLDAYRELFNWPGPGIVGGGTAEDVPEAREAA